MASWKKIVVMLPTYNEAVNISSLIGTLLALRIPSLHILVVDDNSPDGTAAIVTSLMKKHRNVHLLLRRSDKGRGAAGIAGYKKALEMGADVICEMDADFSHDPRFLPSLLEKLHFADVVLGSRAVRGGSDTDRPFFRRLLTKFANLYITLLLGLRVQDCNSGYRCFRRRVLESLNLTSLTSKGPAIVHEVLYRVHLNGFTIGEVPITFVERRKGASKLGFSHLYQGYFFIIKLKILHLLRKI